MRITGIPLLLAVILFSYIARWQPLSRPAQEPRSHPIGTPEELESTRQRLQERIRKLYGADAPKKLRWAKEAPIQEMTKAGDVAEGTKIEEAKNEREIYLDKDPCNGDAIAFHHPYKKEYTDKTKKCGWTTLPILRVIQR